MTKKTIAMIAFAAAAAPLLADMYDTRDSRYRSMTVGDTRQERLHRETSPSHGPTCQCLGCSSARSGTWERSGSRESRPGDWQPTFGFGRMRKVGKHWVEED